MVPWGKFCAKNWSNLLWCFFKKNHRLGLVFPCKAVPLTCRRATSFQCSLSDNRATRSQKICLWFFRIRLNKLQRELICLPLSTIFIVSYLTQILRGLTQSFHPMTRSKLSTFLELIFDWCHTKYTMPKYPMLQNTQKKTNIHSVV